MRIYFPVSDLIFRFEFSARLRQAVTIFRFPSDLRLFPCIVCDSGYRFCGGEMFF